ncbi:zinc finger CCCH domain-containing protein 66-like [Lotus japonicus]|uniref:zinc finger CCCH domain-containing protein 66-like n=1 Tax=Lotus japonicus TaxID=34305 RepID=UPI0025861077|nr:zinc finger CCCH domain-containing protein 66-like [Lotus japonicus]
MENEYGKQEELHHKISALLEFSAADDLIGFKDAVEKEDHDVDEAGLWYGRRVGSNKLGYEERTPLMVAAMFGSLGVSIYILGTGRVDVNRASRSDGATALHCAVAGGSAASPEVVKLLLDASADVHAVDANGNRPLDLIASVNKSIFNPRKRLLQALLEGTGDADQAWLMFPEALDQIEEQQRQDVSPPRVSRDGAEKKDYPADLSLPDIKNGIYGTDEFRMYVFKVKPCSRAYSHDWTECPFVHPGENARRRDPRKYPYSCVPCPEFRKGSCSRGDACEYAHGIFECWLHPAQYRTRLCKEERTCTRRVCFFAHKLEELRPLYVSTGSAIPSPRSYSANNSALEMGSVSPIAFGSPSSMMPPVSTPPLSPSGASSPVAGGAMWQNVSVPALQLPKSRLNTAFAARDIDFDNEFLRLEINRRRQQLMMDEVSGLSSPSNWKNSMPSGQSFSVSLNDHTGELNRLSGVNPANFEDMYGSLDRSVLAQLHGLSLDVAGSQLQSPSGMHQMRPNVNQQPRSYSSSLSTSSVIGSPPFNPSGEAAAAMAFNPRSAAFSKRSQSFIERSAVNRHSELSSAAPPFSVWGSPDRKQDWGMHGEELNKLRKSSSFGFRSSSTPLAMAATTAAPADVNEPDVSWVQSLVKDGAPSESGRFSFESSEDLQKQLQFYINSGADVIPAWLEQLYMEQEQMVA